MPNLRKMRAVAADYPLSGPNATTVRQTINNSAESVFAALEDGPTWKEWMGIDVEWTSEKPFGVGTTRTVNVSGQQIDEVFTAWDEPLRMGFYFVRSTLPLKAFAEDYALTPLGPTSCELSWSFAYEWGGPLVGVFGRIFGIVFKRQGTSGLKKLATLMESTDRFNP